MNVSDSHDFIAGVVQKHCRHGADIAKPLDDHARVHAQHAEFGQRPVAVDEHAAPCGFVAASRSSKVNRFAGHDGGLGVPYVHRIRVHDPGHGLLIGAEVGGGNVALGAEPLDQLGGV